MALLLVRIIHAFLFVIHHVGNYSQSLSVVMKKVSKRGMTYYVC